MAKSPKQRRRWTQEINGQKWTIREVGIRTLARELKTVPARLRVASIKDARDVGGICVAARREILLSETLDRKDRLSVLSHELLHALFPKMGHARIQKAQDALYEALNHL